MMGCVYHRLSVVDLVLLLLLLIVPHQQKTLTASATDPSNLTQCVLQDNDRGLNFGCPMDSMIWVRVGYYGRSPSTSPSQFCENPTTSTSDCIPDPRGDRRLIGASCNTFTYALADKKTYNDIVTLCPSNNGGFPYGYVSFECLPRKQTDGINYIPIVNPSDNSVYRDFYGKTYFLTSGYPYSPTNKNAQFQVSVDGNTKVTIRLLDAFGRLLDATGPCPYTLYLYSSVTNIYREWCVNRTSWTVDDNTAVFPAALPQGSGSGSGSQSIDVVFTKTNANQDAEGAFWMVVEAVNVVDNSPARNVTISCGSSFTSQGRPTTTTTTTSTTTTPTTTTPTTTTPTTTTPTTTTPTTTTPTTTTPTTTTPTTTTPTTTTPTTTTPTTTTTTAATTTTTTTIATTTPTTTTSTTSTARTTPTSTTSTTTSVPSLAPATFPTVTSFSATSSSVTSTTQALTSNNATEPGVSLPTMTSNPTSRPTSGEGAGLNNTSAEKASQNTNVIIGVVVAVVGVIIIIVIIVVVAVICRRNPDRKSKPRPSLMAGVVSPIAFHSNNNDDYGDAAAAAAYKNSSSMRQHGGRDHIYDEIHEPSMGGVMTVSYPPQQHHPAVASPTIRRGQSHKASNGVKVRFMTPGGDEDLVFYPGVSSNVSDDDKANRQTAQNVNEVHPRLLNDFSSSKRLSFTGRQDSSSSSVPSKATGDPNTGIQLNPVYGYRPADIYMY